MRENLLVDAQRLHERMSRPDLCIIDCRFELLDTSAGLTAYCRGHIPGAVYAHLDHDLAGPVTTDSGRHPLPDTSSIATKLGEWGIGNSTDVVTYDGGSGAIAARAWWLLRYLGHERVRLLDGGWSAWLQAGLPVSLEPAVPQRQQFNAQTRPGWLLTTADLVAAGDRRALNLFDARDAGRFRGEHEPIDAVAGHVPGTINRPLTGALGPDMRFLAGAGLAAFWADAPGGERDGDWAVMCGSGVTACHLALSGLLAGRSEPRVYVGSFSEWIRDPARPVAQGAG